MDILEFAENKGDETLKVLRATYDDFHDRFHKIVTALLAGAGATGAYALSRLGTSGSELQVCALGVLSAQWSVIAFYVLRGSVTRKLSPGNSPAHIITYFDNVCASTASDAPVQACNALEATRREEMRPANTAHQGVHTGVRRTGLTAGRSLPRHRGFTRRAGLRRSWNVHCARDLTTFAEMAADCETAHRPWVVRETAAPAAEGQDLRSWDSRAGLLRKYSSSIGGTGDGAGDGAGAVISIMATSRQANRAIPCRLSHKASECRSRSGWSSGRP